MPTSTSAEPTTHGKSSEFSNTKNTGKVNKPKRLKRQSSSRSPQGTQPRGLDREHEESPIRLRVQHYLDGFCHAMLNGESSVLARMWSVPAFVVDPHDTRVVKDAAEVERFFSGAPAMYHERGIVDTRAEIEALDVISENLVMVRVRWPYIDESGREIGSESSTYTLKANDDGDFKMCVCTMRGTSSPDHDRH